MFDKATTTKKQGDIGLGAAIAYFTQIGYTVLIPLTDSQDYDLVIDENGSLKKIQVKTTSTKGKYGTYAIPLRTCGGGIGGKTVKKFNPNTVDYVFALTVDNERYLIPTNVIEAKQTINIGAYKQFKIGP